MVMMTDLVIRKKNEKMKRTNNCPISPPPPPFPSSPSCQLQTITNCLHELAFQSVESSPTSFSSFLHSFVIDIAKFNISACSKYCWSLGGRGLTECITIQTHLVKLFSKVHKRKFCQYSEKHFDVEKM